eukprot:TRINITY_DN7815_c0_g1_i20.p1 TRINITY_DN7815_c0_g1~~TRINITY_DN7815_c0_g1_i20.p1  ORF type:complete len:194 (-),score=52.39 TRINITY_DN7815_c0_g1_i20:286-867(-)
MVGLGLGPLDSGDGCLSVFDIKKRKLDTLSDNMEDELLSIVILRDSMRVVCGSQTGNLNIFAWDEWGNIRNRFPGHPESIDTMVTLTDDVICTGSSDGLIRVVSIEPNKFLGVIGEHEDFPVERIALSRDTKFLGSCSHDNIVKFWDLSFLFAESSEGSSDDEEIVESTLDLTKLPTKPPNEKREMKKFFSDL